MSDHHNSSDEEEDFHPAPEVRSDDEGDLDDTPQKAAEPCSEAGDRSSPPPKKSPHEEEEDELEEVEEEEEEEEEEEDEENEGEGEEDDEDDEEEDAQGHRRKRRKDHRSAFFDIEAEVDEDEEEEVDEDEEEVGNFIEQDNPEDVESARLNDDRRHRELDRRRDMASSMDAEKQAEILRQRYGNRRSGRAGDVSAVPRRLLLPSVDDAKIWAVKAREGKEREVVFSLMKRMDELHGTKNQLKITAAFERAGPDSVMKGYVYVEAMRQADVHTALEGLMNIYPRSKMHLVEIKDMPDLLRVQKSTTLEPGTWVRLRKPFKHAGDLAQVLNLTDTGLEARVRFIPRLDYGLREDAVSADGKRKRPAGPSPRPPQRLFNEQEARKRQPRNIVGNPSTNTWSYNGDEFENGFQVKDVKIQQLIIDDVNPKLEEVTRFASGAEDGTESLDLKALAASLKSSNSNVIYLPGDVVEVHTGEQKGVVGRTTGVQGDIVTLYITEGPLKGQSIDVPMKNLRKCFKMGDHVKVIGGSRFQDEVGMVVKIEEDRVTLVTDNTNNEITVFSRDLREASDSGGQGTLGQFSLHDMVELDPTTVGCIIKIDRESMGVLDQHGDVRQVIPSQIPNKLPPRRHTVATDRNSAELQTGDVVREYGNLQRRGTILHIHRSYLFLQTYETTENGGIFVVRASNVTTVAAKGGRIAVNNGPDLSAMNPALKRQGPKGMAPPPRPMMGRDKTIGQTVIITRGIYKSLMGIVKDATDTTARVELHARNKIISVPKQHLSYRDKITGEKIDPFSRGPRPVHGSGDRCGDRGSDRRVPSWQSGGATPSSERTPAWSHASKASLNGQTPAWKQDGRTPAWADGSRTVNPYDGSRTAYGSGARTPAWAASSGGKTPAHHSYGGSSYGGRTPAYGGDPWNSGSKTPYGASVATPAAPSDGWVYTPGVSGSSAYDAPTPGAGLLSAPTPGVMNAPTPGVYSAPTPGAMSAPTPGGWNSWPDSAPTPAAGAPTPAPYYGAPTPGAYGGVPDTPGPGYNDDEY